MSRRGVAGFLVGAWTLGISLGCASVQAMLDGSTDEDLVTTAELLLQQGDLPGASDEYLRLSTEHPESVSVAVGRAYVQLLAGDFAGADTTLAAIEALAGPKVGEIRLRRALVALEAKRVSGDDTLSRVQQLGEESGLPEGKLLAAEVHLVDLNSDRAIALFREVEAAGGTVGETATTYLRLLESGDQHRATLAEATALWALGDRRGACEAVEDSVRGIPGDDPDRANQLLLWAGRAVSVGLPEVARTLLDDGPPPPGQQWRYQATHAMIKVAEGEGEEGIKMFAALESAEGVPKDGLWDARATACTLTQDQAIARRLVEGVESAAAARCLHAAGSPGAASQAPPGALRQFLETQ